MFNQFKFQIFCSVNTLTAQNIKTGIGRHSQWRPRTEFLAPVHSLGIDTLRKMVVFFPFNVTPHLTRIAAKGVHHGGK